jgi:hypothetical protein
MFSKNATATAAIPSTAAPNRAIILVFRPLGADREFREAPQPWQNRAPDCIVTLQDGHLETVVDSLSFDIKVAILR